MKGTWIRLLALFHRDARGIPWVEALAFDVRLALRGLRRDWTYALASMGMLALALSLNTTVFTVMDAMLFRGFPQVPRNHQLVFLQERDRLGRCCLSYADVEEWQTQAQSFQGIAPVGGLSVAFRDGQGRPMDLRVTTVGANLFGLLGVPPARGRDFTSADAVAGARPVVMLSDRLWQARFGGRADVVGSLVQVDHTPAEIVGVMPAGFEFPLAETDGLWMPIVPTPDLMRRGLTPGGFTAAARLRDGVTLPEARAELEAINRGLEAVYAETNRGVVPTVVDHAQFTSGADARIIWGSLWAAAGLVLLIACANVANLTVVRTVGRWREFVTCLALGAGRWRIVRQMLLESAIIAGASAVPAWSLTKWSMAQWTALAESRYQMVDYSVTAGTLAYLAVVSVAAGVLLCARARRACAAIERRQDVAGGGARRYTLAQHPAAGHRPGGRPDGAGRRAPGRSGRARPQLHQHRRGRHRCAQCPGRSSLDGCGCRPRHIRRRNPAWRSSASWRRGCGPWPASNARPCPAVCP